MNKLKKSSNSKPKVIFIYGPIASGKLTIARILEKKLGYKLAHNHHINDFVEEIFERGTYGSHAIKDKLRYLLIEMMLRSGMNVIVTHCYSHTFVSHAGLTDPNYVKGVARLVKKYNGEFCPVFLKVNKEELLNRVNRQSRKAFKKLTNESILKEWISKEDIENFPKIQNTLVVDNSDISADEAVSLIINHFKLK